MAEETKITARVMIQMMGGPKEHVEKTMKDYVDALRSNKSFKLIEEDISEAEENEDKLFSVITELEIEFKDIDTMLSFCIEAMPSSIEILEPEQLKISSVDLTAHLNDVQSKLHAVDMTIKELKAKRKIMNQNMDNLFVNFTRNVLKEGDKTLDELASIMGISKESLTNYLESLLQRKIISIDDDKYSLI